MAVTVVWDDGTTARWDSGVTWKQENARLPYLITDNKQDLVAAIPDFGVRYLAMTLPAIS